MATFRLLSLTIDERCSEKVRRNLFPGEYILCGDVLEPQFFGKNISVSAIVGKNGAGKSSLLELLFRMVNNFGYMLGANVRKNKKGSKYVKYVDGIYADLKYRIDDELVILKCRYDKVLYSYEGKTFCLFDSLDAKDTFGQERPRADMEEEAQEIDVVSMDAALRIELCKHFFFSVVTNYSLQSYNSNDYLDEEALGHHYVDDIGIDKNDSWLDGVFHKNDGYLVPISLNPERYKGFFDLQKETDLTSSRLEILLIEAKRRNINFIDNYELDDIEYSFSWDYIANKVSLEKDSIKDEYELRSAIRLIAEDSHSVLAILLERYGFHVDDSENLLFYVGIAYLFYKTHSIAASYPIFGAPKQMVNVEHLDEICHDEDTIVQYSSFIKQLIHDKSHLTTKLRKTLNFMKALVNGQNLEESFSYYRDYTHFVGEVLSKRPSLEDRMAILPPPFFKSKVYLRQIDTGKRMLYSKLSSGERQYLFTFSALLYHVFNIKMTPVNRPHYRLANLMLDEVEICFHPEYQRTLVYRLIELLRQFRLNYRFSINIILTTHSPFILSDIPKSNVLYLENGKSVGETIYKDTFGANVNDILHQSFFLKKGFMGEFARDKIQSVIDFLNSKNSSKWTKESSLEFIEKVVSEPILQRQLRSLYEKRYDLRDNKIEKLESEIERLKQKLKDLKK
jgi:ABC-type uncharacterized transport system ATPase subunit